jgi:AraC-like DNA-binding protein
MSKNSCDGSFGTFGGTEMGVIEFQKLERDRLAPLEEFLYEKYRLGLEPSLGAEDFSPTMTALAERHPETAAKFLDICRRVQEPYMPEDDCMLNDMDVFVYTVLRYLPKPRHMHQFFEILFVADGGCENILDKTGLTLQKGDVCFLAPDTPHTLLINRHDAIVYSISVRTSTFKNAFTNIYDKRDIVSDFFTHTIYQRSNSITPYLLCKTDREDVFLSLIGQMVDEQQNQKKFSGRVVNIIFDLFIVELLRRHEFDFTVGKATDNMRNESIIAVLRYIQDNYKTLSLSKAAAFFNCSEAYFSRMIKRYTGRNFIEIIKTVKMQKAESLLLENKKTISEIVEEIGYTDSSHFYKVFKAYFGITPTQYKAAQENAAKV